MIAGVILSGGASRRMGRPKADINFLGEPLLLRMIRIVEVVCPMVVIAAGPNQQLPVIPEVAIVSRDDSEFGGPVQGLRAAAMQLPPDVSHVLVVGCDMPLILPQTLQLFLDRVEPNSGVVARIGGLIQPLPVVLPRVACVEAPTVGSLHQLISQIHVVEVLESDLRMHDPQLISFQPMNTPAELSAALRQASS